MLGISKERKGQEEEKQNKNYKLLIEMNERLNERMNE